MKTDDSMTNEKADKMLNHQGNKLVGYVFEDGQGNFRICMNGAVVNSIEPEKMANVMKGSLCRVYKSETCEHDFKDAFMVTDNFLGVMTCARCGHVVMNRKGLSVEGFNEWYKKTLTK